MLATKAPRPTNVYCFGPFRLDSANSSLTFNERQIPITPRAFSVLQVLVEDAGKLVTKGHLIEKVWGGNAIEDSNITKIIAEVRRVLRPGFKKVDPIRTVWKQGYCFEIPVTLASQEELIHEPEVATPPGSSLPVPPPPTTIRWWPIAAGIVALLALAAYLLPRGGVTSPTRTKVAVLGVRNLSTDSSLDWLGTALAETLTSELQSAAGLSTISTEQVAAMRTDLGFSRASTFNSPDLTRIRANLDARLAVLGTFLVSGSELRVDLQVKDTATGETKGAFTRTGATDKLFDLVAASGVELRRILGEPASPRPAHGPSIPADALRLYAQGLEHLRTWDATGAQQLFAQALQQANGYAPLHEALSATWSILGFEQRAKEEAHRAVEASAGLPREQQLAIEGRYADVSADWPKAIETWRALWRFYPDRIDYAEKLASSLTSGGKPTEAMAMLRRMTSNDPRALLEEARAAFTLADYRAALQAATKAADEARKRSARLLEGRAMSARGEALRRLSEFQQANDAFEQAGALSSAIGDRSGAAQALVNQASLQKFVKKGDPLPLFQKAQTIAEEIGNRPIQIKVAAELSAMHRSNSQMADAIRHTRHALDLARETANLDSEGLNLIDLGNLLNNTGDPRGARKAYEDALARGTEIGNRRIIAISSGNLGVLDYVSGDIAAATTRFEESLKIKRQMGDRDSMAYTLTFLGRVHMAAGRLTDARRYLEESDALLKSIREASIAPVIQMARLSIAEGKPQEAEASLVKLIPQLERTANKCEAWVVMAESQLAQGKLDQARESSLKALEFGSKTPNRADFGIPAGLVAARVEMASGNAAKARTQMSALLAESQKLNHVPNSLNVRHAILQLDRTRESARALQRDAAKLGFGLIASAAGDVDGASMRAGVRGRR